MIKPNTFLIGVQKAATTSVFSWLAQHPDICAPMAVKDLAFFTRDEMYQDKGFAYLDGLFREEYQGESIILQGSVHYIYFEKALERIREFSPEARFILILRDPAERALSAYKYGLKFHYENLPIREAFDAEELRMKDPDVRVRSELTYKSHGLYYAQITTFLKYFSRDQLCVLLYEDVKDRPQWAVKQLFDFLGVDPGFEPNLSAMNKTGAVRNKGFQQLVFGNNPIRNFLVKRVLPLFISEKTKARWRWKLIHMNTKAEQEDSSSEPDRELEAELRAYFRSDIEQLEQWLGRDLSAWKP